MGLRQIFEFCLTLGLASCSSFTCNVDQRSECGYIGISEDKCLSSGCCWSPSHTQADNDNPWCFKPSVDCKGYRVKSINEQSNGVRAKLELKEECHLYSQDVPFLDLQVDFETDTRIHIKITDASKSRFEVPTSQFPRPDISVETTPESAEYAFHIDEDTAGFSITRKSGSQRIFDTSPTARVRPLIFEESYLELSSSIPANAHIYGLGEVVHSFRRDSHHTRQTMWARDAATPVDQNVYGSHPFHLEWRDGLAHGVFLLNSNGMDVILDENVLTYKVIGGILDLYLFLGPSPQHVIKQYQEVIGRPHMIPYWVLGFHHCRYGYKNIDEVEQVVRKFQEASIPLETMWTDIDYMDAWKDFTLDPVNYPLRKMQNFVSELHENHQHYVLILDPAIKDEPGYEPYDDGIRKGIFVKNSKGENFIGKVWPGLALFPDFLNPKTQDYWTKWIKYFMRMLPVDGWWIDMNEPASFCDGECPQQVTGNSVQPPDQIPFLLNNRMGPPPSEFMYRIDNGGSEADLNVKTVSIDAWHYNATSHFDVHNLYGHSEAIMTYRALLDIEPSKRPFVLSRSTFPGTGKYSGHWTGDNWSTWEHLFYSIPGMLNFQMFGIPLVGADICGFLMDSTEELCLRWMQLGAFYPFARNHNSIDSAPQEPYLWESVADASRKALRTRYSLLPYLYTLFRDAHTEGLMVARPLLFEFPDDENTIYLDRQFLLGSGILVSPVLYPYARDVNSYFPDGRWYDFYNHMVEVDSTERRGEWKTVPAPLDHIPVHVRGGVTIPMQAPGMTTFDSRLNAFELLVALDGNGQSTGHVYIDDGKSQDVSENYSMISFEMDLATSLKIDGKFGYDIKQHLEIIYILGVDHEPQQAMLGTRNLEFEYDRAICRLTLLNLAINLNFPSTIHFHH